MSYKAIAGAVLLGLSSVALAADPVPAFPKDAQDEKDPRVQAFYKAQCLEYAGMLKMKQGPGRDVYVTNCMKEMEDLLPVGLEPIGDDEG